MTNFTLPSAGLCMPFALDDRASHLSVYRANPKQAQRIDPLLDFINDGGYAWAARGIPSTQQQGASNAIPASSMYEDQITVPAGSFLTAIGSVAYSSQTSSNSLKYRFRMFDVGSQSDISNDYVHGSLITGKTSPSSFILTTDSQAVFRNHGMYYLTSPLAITSPGQLTIQIVTL